MKRVDLGAISYVSTPVVRTFMHPYYGAPKQDLILGPLDCE